MKRGSWLVLPALLAVVIPSVMAGGYARKCTMTVEDCLMSMTAEIRAHGYSGIDTDKDETTGVITVKRVLPGSPAEAGGLHAGDILVAMNGIRFGQQDDWRSQEALMNAKKSMKIGSQMTYTISRRGAEKTVTLTLGPVPDEVLAQWIGHHMLEHVNMALAKN